MGKGREMAKSIKTFSLKKPIQKRVTKETIKTEEITEEIKVKEKVFKNE